MSDQTEAMLFAQEYATYYAYAVFTLNRRLPRMVNGKHAHDIAPCKLSGGECYNVLVWCSHAYRQSVDWADMRLPCQKTFVRFFKSKGITNKDCWAVVRQKLGAEANAHAAKVFQDFPRLLNDISTQVARYRDNKALVAHTRFSKMPKAH